MTEAFYYKLILLGRDPQGRDVMLETTSLTGIRVAAVLPELRVDREGTWFPRHSRQEYEVYGRFSEGMVTVVAPWAAPEPAVPGIWLDNGTRFQTIRPPSGMRALEL